jgi:nitrite reductase (NADH) large subunit
MPEVPRRPLERCGIFVRTGRSIQAIRGSERVEAVVLDDGTFLSARMVVLACGIRPRVDVARPSVIPVNWGILVSDTLATQVPGVHALGDVEAPAYVARLSREGRYRRDVY